MSAELVPSDRAPGLLIAPETILPDDAEIGPYVTIYPGVEFGSGVILGQGAIIGRSQQVHARSRSPHQPGGQATIIGERCRVGDKTTVVAGARIGADTYLGDGALIREAAVIGKEVLIGSFCAVHPLTSIANRVRIEGACSIGPQTQIETDTFVSGRVSFIGDPTMGRRSVDDTAGGIIVRRACRIGTAAIILPPAEIGEEAVIGAASLVRGDVEPRTVVAGVPAQALRRVRDDELFEQWNDEL
jgi:acetyltransferase-like isoleucine patch superfamily enzyme